MRLLLLTLALLSVTPLFAQRPATQSQAAVVGFAQKAALQALNFHQGDTQALQRARASFAAPAWAQFTKSMQGFLDADGAPAFTSSFVPSGDAMIIGQKDGIVHLRIPGTLKQTQGVSSTTYRAVIDVEAGGQPPKLQHLETMTCPGKSATCQ